MTVSAVSHYRGGTIDQVAPLAKALVEAYASLGYELVMLPKTETAQRADFITRALKA